MTKLDDYKESRGYSSKRNPNWWENWLELKKPFDLWDTTQHIIIEEIEENRLKEKEKHTGVSDTFKKG